MIDYVSNLLLNMSAGLLPEHLSEDDVELLQKYTDEKHGKNSDWFTIPGYWEPEYRRSRFDRHALKQTSIEHE